MIETRGQSTFNDANLLVALACYPVDHGHYSQADGLALEEYYAFYGLNFADAEVTIGILCLTKPISVVVRHQLHSLGGAEHWV